MFAQVKLKETHAQGRTQSGQSFLPLQNRTKFVLEVRSKPASGLLPKDRIIKRPESLRRLGKKETHAQGRTQNEQSFLALQNRSRFVLEVRSKPASGFQALDREIKGPECVHRLG